MNKKQVLIFSFIVLALVQIYVPLSMIWAKETLIKEGKEYKFRTIPVDPNDPFRGKYIRLRFANNTTRMPYNDTLKQNDIVFVSFASDKEGFATINSVSKKEPAGEDFYIKTKVSSVYSNDNMVQVDYPFERFYMEESKALIAEKLYRKYAMDTSKTTYALVNIKSGDAVLKDVCIDGVSIAKLVNLQDTLNVN